MKDPFFELVLFSLVTREVSAEKRTPLVKTIRFPLVVTGEVRSGSLPRALATHAARFLKTALIREGIDRHRHGCVRRRRGFDG